MATLRAAQLKQGQLFILVGLVPPEVYECLENDPESSSEINCRRVMFIHHQKLDDKGEWRIIHPKFDKKGKPTDITTCFFDSPVKLIEVN